MLYLAEGEMPGRFIAHVAAEPACAPLRLQQNVDHHQAQHQQQQYRKKKFSKKFHCIHPAIFPVSACYA